MIAPYDLATRVLLGLKRKRLIDLHSDEFVGVALELSECMDGLDEIEAEDMAIICLDCLEASDAVDELYGDDDELLGAIIAVLIRAGLHVVH